MSPLLTVWTRKLCFHPEKKSLLTGITLSSVDQNGFANRGQVVTGPYSDNQQSQSFYKQKFFLLQYNILE